MYSWIPFVRKYALHFGHCRPQSPVLSAGRNAGTIGDGSLIGRWSMPVIGRNTIRSPSRLILIGRDMGPPVPETCMQLFSLFKEFNSAIAACNLTKFFSERI